MTFSAGEINIICTDVEKSLKFYRDVPGFIPGQDEDGFYHLKFDGRQYLLLPTAKQSLPAEKYETVARFSMDLNVNNLEAAYKYFQEYDVEFAMEWKVGASMFVIHDPDGLHREAVG